MYYVYFLNLLVFKMIFNIKLLHERYIYLCIYNFWYIDILKERTNILLNLIYIKILRQIYIFTNNLLIVKMRITIYKHFLYINTFENLNDIYIYIK